MSQSVIYRGLDRDEQCLYPSVGDFEREVQTHLQGTTYRVGNATIERVKPQKAKIQRCQEERPGRLHQKHQTSEDRGGYADTYLWERV